MSTYLKIKGFRLKSRKGPDLFQIHFLPIASPFNPIYIGKNEKTLPVTVAGGPPQDELFRRKQPSKNFMR